MIFNLIQMPLKISNSNTIAIYMYSTIPSCNTGSSFAYNSLYSSIMSFFLGKISQKVKSPIFFIQESIISDQRLQMRQMEYNISFVNLTK